MGMFDGKGKKSDDSKRQDAAELREKDQGTDAKPSEKQETLASQLQDAPANAAAAGASPERVAQLETMLEQLAKTVEALQKRQDSAGAGKMLTPEALLPKYIQCGGCGQYRSLCKGEHTTIYVLPQAPENMEGFPGITRNAVTYFGTSVVPKVMKEEILCGVANFESYKRKQRFDLGKIRGWDREIAIAMGQRTPIEAREII
jgi:hypothetical protein